MKIHPIVAGVCNAVLPGLGYLLIDERKVFGWLMLAGSAACIILSFFEPAFISQTFFVSHTAGGKFLEGTWYACFPRRVRIRCMELDKGEASSPVLSAREREGIRHAKGSGDERYAGSASPAAGGDAKDTEDHPDPHQ